MTVVDPIFPSLWDATISELDGETAVWEVFADAPNFFAGEPAEVQADEAERVLRRLRDEGWAQFARWTGDARDSATPLSDDEAEAAVRRARTWFLTEREPPHDVPEDLSSFFLGPTEQWRQSDHAAR
jgi:hypothetical protein